jgi:hypothetical protein
MIIHLLGPKKAKNFRKKSFFQDTHFYVIKTNLCTDAVQKIIRHGDALMPEICAKKMFYA